MKHNKPLLILYCLCFLAAFVDVIFVIYAAIMFACIYLGVIIPNISLLICSIIAISINGIALVYLAIYLKIRKY